jgi:hypothetical protein
MKYNARVAKITEANPVDGNGEDDD